MGSERSARASGGAADGALRVRELTAPRSGGVSVLALEGPGVLERVRRLVARPAGLRPGRLVTTRLVSDGELLDEALVWIKNERSIELHLHGSPPLVARLRGELGAGDGSASCASPLLMEEEAERLLEVAENEAWARILLDQAEGALRRALEELRHLATAEREVRVGELLACAQVAARLRHPPRVCLAGPTNAGKSTLFNVLAGEDRALVDARGGTTRDALQARAALGAYAVELFDTAGERELEGVGGGEAEVEAAGQVLGRTVRDGADWVLWLEPDPQASGEAVSGSFTRITSRADELGADARAGASHPLSAARDPEGARALVAGLFHAALGLPAEPWRPGAAVPFGPDHAARLAGLSGLVEADARARIEAWLAEG